MRATGRPARGLAVLAAALAMLPTAGFPAVRADSFRRSDYAATGRAVMRVEAVPARLGRVALVPGSREYWGIAHTRAALPGYDRESAAGQLVFLRHTPAEGWRQMGPPLNERGTPINPVLFSLSLARSGEGWAVGEGGVMLRKAPRDTAWIQSAAATPEAGGADLLDVSLATHEGAVVGYAVGSRATIVRYAGGRWTREAPGTQISADGSPDLASVSTVEGEIAWASTGSSSSALRVYRRTVARGATGGWQRVMVDAAPDAPIFAGPHPARGSNGGINQAAYGAVIVADGGGAWVGGAMVPGDAGHPSGDDLPGDETRPFAIRLFADGSAPQSYCPDQYSLRTRATEVEVDRTPLCERPFPISSFGIASLQVVGREVFAGGLGLYRFRDGGWSREPDPLGFIVSLAMSSARDGWAATTGNTYGTGGAVHAGEAVAGRWSERHQPVRVARWPQPNQRPLFGVAVAPDRSGRAFAVGDTGVIVSYLPEAGWDAMLKPGFDSLYDVAWAGRNTAVAVGAQGSIATFDGRVWSDLPLLLRVTGSSLFGVAFRSPREGVAVGADGTVLRYDGGRWRVDSAGSAVTDEDLYDVAYTPGGIVAVGDNGTLIEHDGTGWRTRPEVGAMLDHPSLGRPALYAVSALGDGTVVAGGAGSALIVRDPGGRFHPFQPSVEGTVLALAASGSSGSLRMLTSLSPDARKFNGDQIAATRASLLWFDGTRWRDLGMSRRRTIYASSDPSAFADPPYAIALDSAGRGWAVGGFPADVRDDEDHLRFDPTSSVYRFDEVGDPAPGHTVADVRLPSSGITFAFFGETWCGQGVCSMAAGSGTQADLAGLAIREEIERAAGLPGGPKFAMFGGSGRGVGIPEEAAQQASYLNRFDLPVYGALGTRDLFGETDGTAIDLVTTTTGQQAARLSDHWQRAFAGFPAPWGDGQAPSGIRPVRCNGCAQKLPGLAATHYAFDVMQGSKALVRIIVVDSSARSLGQPFPNEQNPRESQRDWINAVLADARSANNLAGVPTMIAMNQPTFIPERTPLLNWTGNPSDATNFQSWVVANAVSGVLTGGVRMATRDGYPTAENVAVPIFVMGTGGAPLGYDPPSPGTPLASKLPSDGYYHAWFLVNVDPARPRAGGLPGQVSVDVRPFPILDSVALHAPDGRSASAGQTLRFSALARGLPGGFSDPEQSRTTYFSIGHSSLAPCEAPGQGFGTCASREALSLPYRFWSEDPEIADFVLPDFGRGPRVPLRRPEGIRRDPGGEFGLLCAFKTGSTFVNVESGFHRARMRVTVGAGFGDCVDRPVVGPTPTPSPPFVPSVSPPEPAPRPVFRVPPHEPAVAIFPPPPAPAVAPAPPGAPGVGRKEEHEVETELEGYREFRALPLRARTETVPEGLLGIGAAAVLALGGAVGLSVWMAKRAAVVWEERRW